MSEYPDFVPSRFAMGRFRAWGARDPRRGIAYLAGNALGAVGIVTLGTVTDSLGVVVAGAATLAFVLVEGAIRVPRALRAMHRRAPG